MSTHSSLGNRIDDDGERNGREVADSSTVGDTGGWQFSRYDLLLVCLPLPLVLGFEWATMTAAPMSAGVGLGSVPTLVLLAYSLFVGGPTDPATATVEK